LQRKIEETRVSLLLKKQNRKMTAKNTRRAGIAEEEQASLRPVMILSR
jgi:hypothetical protein